MFEEFGSVNQQDMKGSSNQLRDFIFRMQEELFARGETVRAQIQSVEELKSHNKSMRESFLRGLGGLPESAKELDARVVRISDREEFTLETIVFCSRPRTYVTASLYLPKGISLPAPAILFVCGHTTEGRMDPNYQMVCQTLARAGLIVFAMDPTGQGERSNYYNPETGEYLIERGTADHDACGIPAAATGKFLERYFLRDEMRAVDYMLTRPEIDPERIGVTGNSGGGTQTLAMMACDDRIAAAAPGTFTSSRREIMYCGLSQDAEQIWPEITECGFDHVSPFMIFAPRPAAILAVISDFFPIEGTVETFETAKTFYKLYGKEENLRMYEDDYIHEYTPWLAIRAAEFFTEVFYGEKRTVRNDDLEFLPLEEMRAFPSGNVLGGIPSAASLKEEICGYAIRQREKRRALPENVRRARAKEWLKERVMAGRMPAQYRVKMYPNTYRSKVIDGYRAIPLSWWSQRRLYSFGLLIRREQEAACEGQRTVLAVWPEGTKAVAAHEDWIRQKCDEGQQVLVLDVPGEGDLKQSPLMRYMGEIPYTERDGTLFRLCIDLIFSGDSMAAMHCYDVLRAIGMLEERFGLRKEDITLYCEGREGVYGVMAGFLCEDVQMEYGTGLLLSVEREILGQEIFRYENTYSLIVPGMLEYFDYEELLR